MTDVLDITSEAVADKADCKLTSAKGEPLLDKKGEPRSITMWGPASEKFTELQSIQSKRAIEMARNRSGDLSATESARLTAEDLALMTVSFNGFTYPHPDGKDAKWKSDREMFVACYMDPKIGFIRDQANAFFGRWGNFSAGSATK